MANQRLVLLSGPLTARKPTRRRTFITTGRTVAVVYITRGLLTALLELAAERDPSSVTVALAVTPAEELDAELPTDSSVFTDMYLPNTGGSVTAVFGMDLSTPSAAGRFISHPDGSLTLTKADDLHEVAFVAVPPYEDDCVAAFDRAGRDHPFEVIDAAPPPGRLEDYSR